jgi:hypothetical protein
MDGKGIWEKGSKNAKGSKDTNNKSAKMLQISS